MAIGGLYQCESYYGRVLYLAKLRKVKVVEHVFQLAPTYLTHIVYVYTYICTYKYANKSYLYLWVLHEITKHEPSTCEFNSSSLRYSDAMQLHLHPP